MANRVDSILENTVTIFKIKITKSPFVCPVELANIYQYYAYYVSC